MADPLQKLTPGDLTALMCARICHDLISPVGALSTALEVLDDEDNEDLHADALELVKNSAKQASGKLQFLRLAFGAGSSAPGIIPLSTVADLIDGMYGHTKLDVSLDTDTDGLEKDIVRLMLNLCMIANMCVPGGGTVVLTQSSNADKTTVQLTASGKRARFEDGLAKALTGKAPEDGFDGRSIQPFYTGMIIRDLKGQMSVSRGEGEIKLLISLPQKEAQDAA